MPATARRVRVWLSPVNIARRKAITSGLLGGNRAWFAVGMVIFVGRKVRTLVSGAEEIAATERLRPGERLLLTTIPTPTRKERKAAKAAAKAARRAR